MGPQSCSATDRYPAFARRPAREPEFETCERCDAEISTDPTSRFHEVQCRHCGRYHCNVCDLEHMCPGSDACSACHARVGKANLTLAPCDCDEELCSRCLAAHVCPRPATLAEAHDSWAHELAEGLVARGAK